MTPRRTLIALAAVATLAGCGGSPKPAPAVSKGLPKRIVLVTIDTWRSDALGASGSGRVKTPNLDAFAKAGYYCPRAWAPATLTAPSHGTILTGLEPYHHGVRDNHGYRLSPSLPTLASLLRDNGFATAAFVSAHPVARIMGFDHGFTVYDDRCAPGDPLSVVPRWRPGAETIEVARVWLRTAPERFFLWVHLYEPHEPYLPPEPYKSAYPNDPYFGEVAYADELVGRLKAALGTAGEQDALWVITGDHGESLGAHGEATHGLFVYDETARVPLIVWAPGSVPTAQHEFARLVDVTPTVLALAGLRVPAGLDGNPLVGGDAPVPETAYVETMYPFLNFGVAPVRALSDGVFKFIDVPRPEIYDLSVDPAEARNLAGLAPGPRATALRTALTALPAAPGLPDRKPADDEAQALRSLGYIGAGGDYALARVGMDPKDFAPLYLKLNEVRVLCDARRFAAAVPIYKQLLAAFPRSSLLACELGLVQMALGKTAEAETYLRLALDRDRGNSHALLGMANLALSRGDLKGAEERLLETLALDPDDVEANLNLGALYLQNLGEPAKAIGYLQRFLELQPTDPEAPRIRQLVNQIKSSYSKR